MRLLFLNPSGQTGGAERSLLDVLASLRAAEPEWELHLVASADGPLVAQAAALGVATTVLPFPPRLAALGDAAAGGPAGRRTSRAAVVLRMARAAGDVLGYARRLRRVARVVAPELIHTNGFKMHLLGTWAAPARTPVVWHVHDYVRARPLMARLLRARARRCAAIVANSHSVADDAAAAFPGVPVHCVHNATDLARFAPAGPLLDLDRRAGLAPAPAGTVRVGLVATMALWKGHEVFLRALALLPRELPVRGYVVGGAIYETIAGQHAVDELRTLAERLGVADRVGFTGLVDDAAAAMRALDVVVHASTEPEPFGLVIAEAMACGRATVVAYAGGAAELVTPGHDALAHPPGDAAALAERIARLAGDAELRARLGANARATAEARFDRARLAAQLVPIYRGAAARP